MRFVLLFAFTITGCAILRATTATTTKITTSTTTPTAAKKSSSSTSLSRAQNRAASDGNAKLRASQKANIDMQSVMQQHLIGSNIANSNPHNNNNNNKNSATASAGGGNFETKRSSKEDGKKGRLQTVGSVLGDIIGVLIAEVARFFGSVVSDVAREVTAHGFVSLLKQFADFTKFSFGGSGASGASGASVAAPVANLGGDIAMPNFG